MYLATHGYLAAHLYVTMSKFTVYCKQQTERERLIILLDGDLEGFKSSGYRTMRNYLLYVKGIQT